MNHVVGDVYTQASIYFTPEAGLGDAVKAGAGFIGGYIAGQVLEELSLRHIEKNRQAALPAHDNVEKNRNPLRRSVAFLACLGAVTGYAYGIAGNHQTETVYHESPGTLEMAVDHSYQVDTDGTLNNINAMASSFLNVSSDRLREQTWISNDSTARQIKLSDLKHNRPFGQATAMTMAATQAMDSATAGTSKSKTNEHSNGLLILTNNNAVGDIQSQDTSNVPVYIINFGKNSTNAAELKQTASATGGEYKEASQTTTSKVIKAVESGIRPASINKSKLEVSGAPALPIAIALTGLMAYQFMRRRRETVA